MCCVRPDGSVCKRKPSWPYSCATFIESSVAKVFFWIVGFLRFILNVGAFTLPRVSSKISKGIREKYRQIVGGICFGDALYFIWLLIISIADSVMDLDFLQFDVTWRGNIISPCTGYIHKSS